MVGGHASPQLVRPAAAPVFPTAVCGSGVRRRQLTWWGLWRPVSAPTATAATATAAAAPCGRERRCRVQGSPHPLAPPIRPTHSTASPVPKWADAATAGRLMTSTAALGPSEWGGPACHGRWPSWGGLSCARPGPDRDPWQCRHQWWRHLPSQPASREGLSCQGPGPWHTWRCNFPCLFTDFKGQFPFPQVFQSILIEYKRQWRHWHGVKDGFVWVGSMPEQQRCSTGEEGTLLSSLVCQGLHRSWLATAGWVGGWVSLASSRLFCWLLLGVILPVPLLGGANKSGLLHKVSSS